MISDNIYKDVNRLEVIDGDGRSYVKYGITEVEFSLQDYGYTLKIFIREKGDEGTDKK